ncbi:hypothetical protein CBS101457_001033 [Exobasidium rhododendri]|nr:hypothetical protein CBS101457_001033 [Exobasidium rhododendri]
MQRDGIGSLLTGLGGILGGAGTSTTASASSATASSAGSGAGSSGSSAATSRASGGSSTAAGAGGGGASASPVPASSSNAGVVASAAPTTAGGSGNTGAATTPVGTPAEASSSAAAAAAAAASASTVTLAATVTSAITTVPTISSADVLTTMLITAADGSVETSVLSIAPNPTTNPFGNVAIISASSINSAPALSSIVVPPGGYGPASGSDTDNSSSNSSNHDKVIIPVAVVAGVVALGLLIALFMWRQRRSMKRELNQPHLISSRANLIAATTGTLGFTSAGVFTRNRRGSDYRKSSEGHYVDDDGADDQITWPDNRPISEAIIAGELQYDDDNSSMNASDNDRHQTFEVDGEEMAAAAAAPHGILMHPDAAYNGYGQTNIANAGPMDSRSDESNHLQSVITGEEGGYATASEDGKVAHGSFFDHNQTEPRKDVENDANYPQQYDGSAPYGYSNPAVKGLDAAALQGATGNQTLSPYNNLQRGNDARQSMANTEYSVGQAYGGADLDSDPFDFDVAEEGRPNPHYDGNTAKKQSHFNSNRWSG